MDREHRDHMEAVLMRVGGNQATQRLCRAWFARFTPETIESLTEAPPEVFELLIGHVVREMIRVRRKSLWLAQSIGFIQALSTAFNLWIGLSAFAFTCLCLGWWGYLRLVWGLTPESMTPPFIVNITRLPSLVQNLQENNE